MRHVLPFLLVLLAAGFGWSIHQLLQSGESLRVVERDAQRDLARLMRAQERWRARPDRDPDSAPYGSLSTLIEHGELPGFALAPEVERGGAVQVARAGDYYFELSLRPGASRPGTTPKLGGRYQVWAWPAREGHNSSLLFWGSNAGYLIQGENGQSAGNSAPPYGVNPLKEVTEAEERIAQGGFVIQRWVVLGDIRGESEVTDADP